MKCPMCNGMGNDPTATCYAECPQCGGTGEVGDDVARMVGVGYVVPESNPTPKRVPYARAAGRAERDGPPPGYVEPPVARPVPMLDDVGDVRPFVAHFDDGSSMRLNAYDANAARVEATDTARADGRTCRVVRVVPAIVRTGRKRP